MVFSTQQDFRSSLVRLGRRFSRRLSSVTFLADESRLPMMADPSTSQPSSPYGEVIDVEDEEEPCCCGAVCEICCADNVRSLRACCCCLGRSARESWTFCRHVDCGAASDICTVGNLKRKLPILQWMPKYSLKCLQGDLIAGFAVGLTVLPQALAYARLALLPPQYGLYTSFMCAYVYGFLGTSKDISIGPAAVMSLLTGEFAQSPVPGDATYAIVLALMCGIVQFLMGALHIGFIVDYVSHPVIEAFIQSAVLTIMFSQIKNWLGLKDVPREFIPSIIDICKKLPETQWEDFLLGTICMIILFGMKKMKQFNCGASSDPSIPMRVFKYLVWLFSTARNAIVVIVAAVVAYVFYQNGKEPFELTGEIPPGLPPFRPPAFSDANSTYNAGDIFSQIGFGFVIVPFISIIEAIAIAKAFGKKNNYKVDPNQELLALGVANVLGSFVQAYPVTGSFSRSAVNGQSGVRTPAGQWVTATMVVLVVSFATPLFYYIPDAALAAIIIMAVTDMFDFTPLIHLWQVKKLDIIPWIATFVIALTVSVEIGLVTGIVISLFILLYPAARPGMQIRPENAYTVVTLNQGLVYPSSEYFQEHIMEKVLGDAAASSAVNTRRVVILDFIHVSNIDSTIATCLEELTKDIKKIKSQVVFCNVRANVQKVMDDAEIKHYIRADSVEEAIKIITKSREMLVVDGDLTRDQVGSEVPSSTDVSTVGLLIGNGGPATQGAPSRPPTYSQSEEVIKDGPLSGAESNEDLSGDETAQEHF